MVWEIQKVYFTHIFQELLRDRPNQLCRGKVIIKVILIFFKKNGLLITSQLLHTYNDERVSSVFDFDDR